MNSYNQKEEVVNSVFSSAYKKYDLMNDLMSFGIHRLWKKKVIDWIKPQEGDTLVDVAAGTGDLAKIFSEKVNHNSQINCVEPNKGMFNTGIKKLKKFSNISWTCAKGENLPFENNKFDFYTISFGIRNVTDINKCINEALRVLKPGGRFVCLEFSKIDNELLNFIYKNYSKIIPSLGSLVSGDPMPYKYLIESIDSFYNQEDLKKIILKNGFTDVEYRNLSNGVAAIHSGWKV
tara:strand:- start:488 stop:1189 length:702 start_codon:yes stop_codon:yes gene_type:complete